MKIGGQILWNVTPICETSEIWWEDASWKTFWATIWRTDYSIWFIGWVLPYNCEGSVPNLSIWKESFTWIVPRIRSVRGWNLEGWRADRTPWGVGDDGRIGNLLKKRPNAKEVIFPKQGELIFPIADGRIKTLGGDQELKTSTLVRHRQIQGDSNIDFPGESEGSLPQPHDSFPDAGEAINDFWSMSGSFIYRHHVEPRVKLYSPREESFPIQLKYIDVTRTNHTNLDVKQEKRIDDYWNIDGSRNLSDPWTGFTHFTLLEEKAPDGYTWYRGRLTRKELTSRPDHGQNYGNQWESMRTWRRSKSGRMRSSIWKTHESWEGFISLTRRTRNSKKPSRMRVRSWKHQWLLLCREKLWKIVGMVNPMKSNQNFRVFRKLMNLQDCVWENLYQIFMKTILQEKETIHCSIWTKNTNNLRQRGRNFKTLCIGSTSILIKRKDWSSIRHDRTPSLFTKHSQLTVFRELLGWKLEKSHTRRYTRHFVFLQRSPCMTGWKNWVQELFSDQMEPVVFRDAIRAQGAWKTSRFQEIETRSFHEEAVKHDRTETPRCLPWRISRARRLSNTFLSTSTLEKKQIMIERVHSLFAVTQVTRKVTSKQYCTRWTLTSECVDCHILLWNKLRTLVFFLNWSRRSRTTLTDILFNSIYNKTKPTTRSVRRQRKYQGRGHCRAVWIVRDGP